MKRLILPIVIAGCVVAASVFAGPAKEKPAAKKKPKEEWYKLSIGGKPAGYMHSVVKYEQYKGRKIRREVSEGRMVLGLVECVIRTEDRCELDGQLISESMVSEFAGMPGAARLNEKYTATIANGVLTVTATGPDVGKGMKKEIRLRKGLKVYGGVTEWLLKRHGIGPGDVAEFHVFSSTTLKPEKSTVKKFERVKHVHKGKKIDAFRVTIKRADDPDDKVMIMTTDYELLEIKIGQLAGFRSNKKDALANVPPKPPANEIDDDIPIENKIDDKVRDGGVEREVAPE